MKCEPLPATLKVGDKIVQTKYTPHERLEVFKIDAVDRDRVWLMYENGNALTGSLSMQLLKAYDYQLITEE